MNILALISWLRSHVKLVATALVSILLLTTTVFSVNLYRKNKQLTDQLNYATNNIEAYQGIINDTQQANNVLRLDLKKLDEYNDSILNELDKVRKQNNIKSKEITTAATQRQTLNVSKSKGVGGDLTVILKDTIYKDTIKYNDLTTISYTIGKDTVNIGVDLQNTQYLYVYTTKEYKNKKNFLQRLFTFDWKKIKKYKYKIVNTNDLLKSEDVRVVESNEK